LKVFLDVCINIHIRDGRYYTNGLSTRQIVEKRMVAQRDLLIRRRSRAYYETPNIETSDVCDTQSLLPPLIKNYAHSMRLHADATSGWNCSMR
jgi:hypothetical protein